MHRGGPRPNDEASSPAARGRLSLAVGRVSPVCQVCPFVGAHARVVLNAPLAAWSWQLGEEASSACLFLLRQVTWGRPEGHPAPYGPCWLTLRPVSSSRVDAKTLPIRV